MSMLLISHDLLTVAAVCHRLAILHEGEIVECGPVDDVALALPRLVVAAVSAVPYVGVSADNRQADLLARAAAGVLAVPAASAQRRHYQDPGGVRDAILACKWPERRRVSAPPCAHFFATGSGSPTRFATLKVSL